MHLHQSLCIYEHPLKLDVKLPSATNLLTPDTKLPCAANKLAQTRCYHVQQTCSNQMLSCATNLLKPDVTMCSKQTCSKPAVKLCETNSLKPDIMCNKLAQTSVMCNKHTSSNQSHLSKLNQLPKSSATVGF